MSTTTAPTPTPAPPHVPFMSVGLAPDEIAAATEVLESGMLRAASRCAEFETRFAEASQATHALTCANGTCALQLAYHALLQPGDEVIVPAWTYIATASMLAARGCKIVFCDCLEDSFQIDPADVARRITPNTKAIACTHLYGIPVDVAAIQAIAAEHNLKVIYDAAQAHLAEIDAGSGTQGLGAFGDAVTYSFYATKNLGTGEGGMVTTNDDAVARSMSLARSHGETDKYVHESVGFNYRMNDITGAIGLKKLEKLPAQTELRRAAADRYTKMLESIEGVIAPEPTKGSRPAWHLYTCKLDTDALTCSRDQFCDELRARGVPTAVHYPRSLTRQPAFAEYVTDHPPVADALPTRVFCVPMHHALTDTHFDQIEQALRELTMQFKR